MSEPEAESEVASPPPVFRFPNRPEWGLGILVEEREGKRYYDFEDGERHILLEQGWAKLEEVDLTDDERSTLDRKLRGLAARKEAVAKRSRKRAGQPKPARSFADQLAMFDARFPGGFLGDAYVEKERAPADRRGPKGYKERILQMAQSSFSREEIERMRGEGDLAGIMERVRKVMQSAFTLMHPQSDVIPFSKLGPEHHSDYVDALVDLLHGTGDYTARFDRYVEVLARKKVTWPMATFLPAVCHPNEHLFVKPAPLEEQASVLGMDVGYEPDPTSQGYARLRAVGESVRERLVQAGHAPRDFLDVYTFIWLTRNAPPAEGSPPAG